MTTTDYLINIALIALVILQIRGSRLDLKTVIRPMILVAAAAVYYLRGFPLAGNDVVPYVVLGGLGLVLGVACAATIRVWRASDGHGYTKAGVRSRAQAVRYAIGNGLTGPGRTGPGRVAAHRRVKRRNLTRRPGRQNLPEEGRGSCQ